LTRHDPAENVLIAAWDFEVKTWAWCWPFTQNETPTVACNEEGKCIRRSVMSASDLRLGLDKAIPHKIRALEDSEFLPTIEREIK